jgi:hypothetical protein
MRERNQLTGAPVELLLADGRSIPVDIDIVRIEAADANLMIAIATEHKAPASPAVEARLLDVLPDAVLAIDAAASCAARIAPRCGCSKRRARR